MPKILLLDDIATAFILNRVNELNGDITICMEGDKEIIIKRILQQWASPSNIPEQPKAAEVKSSAADTDDWYANPIDIAFATKETYQYVMNDHTRQSFLILRSDIQMVNLSFSIGGNMLILYGGLVNRYPTFEGIRDALITKTILPILNANIAMEKKISEHTAYLDAQRTAVDGNIACVQERLQHVINNADEIAFLQIMTYHASIQSKKKHFFDIHDKRMLVFKERIAKNEEILNKIKNDIIEMMMSDCFSNYKVKEASNE